MKTSLQLLHEAVVAHSGLETQDFFDVATYGASSGFSGFIYYTDTNSFYEENTDLIWELLAEEAEMCGVSPTTFIGQFSIAETIDSPTGLANALAWYALETVARSIVEASPGVPWR